MAIFAVIAPGADPTLKSAVAANYAGRFFEIVPGQFMVKDTGQTSQQVAIKLGANNAGGRRFIVVSVGSYWGVHREDLWEWLKVNSG